MPRLTEHVGDRARHLRLGDEANAFDEDFEFPALLWSPELSYPVYAVPRSRSGLDEWLDDRRVRVMAVGPRHRAQLLVDTRWRRAFECRSADCTVFVRDREAMSAR